MPNAGVVVAPEDVEGIAAALRDLHGRWRDGLLEDAPLAPEWKARVSRRARVQELADLLAEAHVRRLTSFLFLGAAFCVTFEKVHWNAIGTVGLADVFALLFLASFAVTNRRWRVPRTTAVVRDLRRRRS